MVKLPFGNGRAAIIGIVIFIGLFVLAISKCGAAEQRFDFGLGTSISHGAGQALDAEIDYRRGLGFSERNDVYWWAGTTLLGYQDGNQSNWAWHTGFEGHKGAFRVGLGAAFLQRVDGLNGSHTNYTLTCAWAPRDWIEVRYRHFSNAGTTDVNVGRDVLLVMVKIR